MRLLVSALEPSSNLHLANILKETQEIHLDGIFDSRFGSPIYSPKEFGVMGVVDVIGKILLAKKAIKEMVALSNDCDKVLLIDAPAFNIPLAKAIKKAYPNKKIIYYILPKVWAWKKGRIETIKKYTDIQAYIFPFEREFWTNGMYVGNPLMEEIKSTKNSPSHEWYTTAFLPGSRRSEIKKPMPVFWVYAKKLDGKKVLSIPPIFSPDEIASLYGDISAFDVSFDAKETLLSSDRAIVCSGTATLEAAIIGVPFVPVYKAKKIDYFIGRMFVKLAHVGLANIIFDFEGLDEFHAELLQEAVTAEKIDMELKKIDTVEFFEKSRKLRELLSQKDEDIATILAPA